MVMALHRSPDVRARPLVRKVPEVIALFWVAKVLTTGMGEATSDFLVRAISPYVAVALGANCAADGSGAALRGASIPPVPPNENVLPDATPLTEARSGSDFMVDCLKTLNIDYVACLPASTFRGLQESLLNYGMNTKPEFIMCLHEECAVAMAHGYAKVAKKPMAALVHGTVGLQHAAMAIYNAYADRAPIVVLSGNIQNTAARRPKYSALSNVKMESLGIDPMPSLDQAIGLYLLARSRRIPAGTLREVSPSA